MNITEQNTFIIGLSIQDAIEIVGLNNNIENNLRIKLAALNEYEGACYNEHFKGIPNTVPKPIPKR